MLRSVPLILGPSLLRKRPGVNIAEVSAPIGAVFTNPSITVVGERLVVAVRSVSYHIDRRGRYVKWTPVPTSGTWVGELDPGSLDMRGLRELVEEKTNGSLVLEDARLVALHGEVGALWAGRDYTTGRYRVDMHVGRIVNGQVTDLRALPSPNGAPVEKNWMPFVDGEELFFLYSPASLERYRLTGNGLAGLSAITEHNAADLVGHSGSSQLVPWREGWLGVTHTHSILALPMKLATWRFYRHHLVYFSRDFTSHRVSPAFNFLRRGIEFCAGLAVTDDRVYLSFGSRDSRAFIAALPPGLVDDLIGGTTR
jgi:hypothetical protein